MWFFLSGIRCFLLILLCCNVVFAAADLEIKTLTGQPEDELKLEFVIANHGPDQAAHLGCNIYLYANERLILSQALNLSPLEPGASRTEEVTLDLPNPAITAVKVEVFDSVQPDTQPSTNFLQMNLKPPDLRKADLQIVDVKPDEKEKDKGMYNVRIRNNGPDQIGVSKLAIDLEVFGEVIAHSEKKIDRLNVAEESEIKVQIPKARTIPSPNGILNFRWFSSGIEDSQSSNNVYKLPVQLVLRMPDLVPVRPSIDRKGVLTFTIQNRGNARADASITALYINGALVERYDTPEMTPRGRRQFNYRAANLSTDDKILIVADFNADVAEASEENNRHQLLNP